MRALLFWLLRLSIVVSTGAWAAGPVAPDVGLSIIQTAGVPTREGMLHADGDLLRPAQVSFAAFLIRHGDEYLLVDTGLGEQIDAQYAQDMPWWLRPFFGYDKPVVTVRQQLVAAGLALPEQVLLTHVHWDHASGVPDFPRAQVWISAAERELVRRATGGAATGWPSQVGSTRIRWQELALRPVPFEGFGESLDWWGDGSVVVVSMYGHTPGSVGVFVRVSSGKRYFLVGDVVWSSRALINGSPKSFAARMIVDADTEQTAQTVERIRAAQRRDPTLVVVPAHDAEVHASLGRFPAWVP